MPSLWGRLYQFVLQLFLIVLRWERKECVRVRKGERESASDANEKGRYIKDFFVFVKIVWNWNWKEKKVLLYLGCCSELSWVSEFFLAPLLSVRYCIGFGFLDCIIIPLPCWYMGYWNRYWYGNGKHSLLGLNVTVCQWDMYIFCFENRRVECWRRGGKRRMEQ